MQPVFNQTGRAAGLGTVGDKRSLLQLIIDKYRLLNDVRCGIMLLDKMRCRTSRYRPRTPSSLPWWVLNRSVAFASCTWWILHRSVAFASCTNHMFIIRSSGVTQRHDGSLSSTVTTAVEKLLATNYRSPTSAEECDVGTRDGRRRGGGKNEATKLGLSIPVANSQDLRQLSWREAEVTAESIPKIFELCGTRVSGRRGRGRRKK